MKKIEEMTIEEKIGQLFCCGFQGYEFSDDLKYLIDKYKLGNIILFTRNIKDVRKLHDLNSEIHKYVIKKTGIMPLISIDQEGGMVTRIMDEATFCPGNMTLATTNSENAEKIGHIMGKELRALGINMNLAPSLDVNNNPLNPVIGVRSYSDDPEVVSKYGLNYIRGLQEEGVIATAKHFPGHGDTASDSHKSLPVIPHNKERLERIELLPFKKVLNETKAIMSAHVFFPAYEEGNLPGTLSPKVITSLLRKQLGYTGLIVSDCMEMKAIDDNYTTPKGCLMGLLAGLDQVMVSATFQKQIDSFELVYKAVKDNVLTEEMIDEKLRRVLKAKNESLPYMEKYFYNKAFDDVKETIINEEHKKISRDIVDDSLTLVKGKNILINKRTLIITTEPFATTIAEDELNVRSIGNVLKESKLKSFIESGLLDIEKIKVGIDDKTINSLIKKSMHYEQVLICTYNANIYEKQAELVNKLLAYDLEVFVLSTRSPYDIYRFPGVKNYLCLYEYTPNSVNTVVKYLEGELTPKAKLPVSLERNIGVGASLYVGLPEYPLEQNLKYIDLLSECQIEYLFISAHMPEMKKNFIIELNKVCEYAYSKNIKVCLDVSKPMMKDFVCPNIYSLRLDYGFTLEEIADIYRKSLRKEVNYKVELNASTISTNDLLKLRSMGVILSDVRISHNFFPKEYTGLSYENVIEKNKIFHELGMKVMIYIPSNNQKRPPMYQGLPTVEKHRYMNIFAILSSIKYLGADEVFFSDAYASKEELSIAKDFDYDVVTVPIEIMSNISILEKEILKRMQTNRKDESAYYKRSSIRISNDDILPNNILPRKKFYVTIDNVKFARYQGEVCILKDDLPSDKRVNVVGRALIDDEILKAITPGKRFRFVIVGEIDEGNDLC